MQKSNLSSNENQSSANKLDNVNLLIDEARALSKTASLLVTHALCANLRAEKPRASASLMRRELHELSRIWIQLKNARAHILRSESDELVEQFELVFSTEFETIFDSFESMCRIVMNGLSNLLLPDQSSLLELAELHNGPFQEVCDALLDASLALSEANQELQSTRTYIDEVTGLPNRRGAQKFARRFIEDEWPHEQVSVFQIDLNKFKQINNVLGLDAGDAALVHVAKLIKQKVSADDFVARVGGDEFAIATFGNKSKDELLELADDLLVQLSEPFDFGGKSCDLRSSIGVASGTKEEDGSIRRIMSNAERALQKAKQTGGSQRAYFSKNLRIRYQNTDELQSDVLNGLEAGQFEPYYQPQIESRTGKLVGFEALARWMHPTRGVLTPFHFLEALEEADLLFRVDLGIMQHAFGQLRKWLDSGFDVPQVSINLSSDRLLRPDLLDSLLIATEEANVPTSRIGIEILESAMIDADAARMINNINKLSEAGFVVELDDFGTGHASVSNLQNFKVDRIKIDRSFVKDIHLQTDLAKITSAMIGLAHSLRIDALAEGVETPEERLILNVLGCDHIQGYGVSHPLPAAEVAPWITKTQKTKRELPPRRG